MELKVTNKNYCAVITRITKLEPLANCDNIQGALIFGNHVIVGKDTKVGDLGVFFPAETRLDPNFVGINNLYRKPEFGNTDTTKKGFFEQHCRVRVVKFRGHKSEGFFTPISFLDDYLDLGGDFSAFPEGLEFNDVVYNNGLTDTICKKYVPKMNPPSLKVGTKAVKKEDAIVDGQFRLHYDTENLRRNTGKINPDDYISISEKLHGSSAVISNLLVKRKLKWYERFLSKAGVKILGQEYGFIWSSRRVIKGVDGHEFNNFNYYSSDIWGLVANDVREAVKPGITLYGEIVGFTPEGSPIQKDYAYNCKPREHAFYVYRITLTNTDGYVVEFSWSQMLEYCKRHNLNHVPERYFGKALDLVVEYRAEHPIDPPRVLDNRDWQEDFLKAVETMFVDDRMCSMNSYTVPAEGVVVRVDRLNNSEALKLKSFAFTLQETKQLDDGIIDLETQEGSLDQDVENKADN